MFEGVYVALVTPFLSDGSVDIAGLKRLADDLIERGIHGLVPCGSTGESATLSHAEHVAVIRAVVEVAAGRVPVLAGTGSNSTREAIALTKEAKEAGADGALLITPYYNKPTQPGLIAHYRAVAEEVDFPIVLYNIPGRTAVTLAADSIGVLARDRRIVGLKEATGSIEMATDVLTRTPADFTLTAGDDAMTLPLLAIGAKGVISVVAHLVPERMLALWNAWQSGEAAKAAAIHRELFPLIRALFTETNPGPIKEALYMAGAIARADLRLPLVRTSKPTKAILRDAMAAAGIALERDW